MPHHAINTDFPPEPLVLLVDDDEIVRHSISDYLQDSHYRVIQASDGLMGLDMVRERTPDLIVCDLRMPELDGLSMLRTLRADDVNTPVIFLSGAGSVNDVAEALRFGATDYLVKPVMDMAVLENSLQRAIEGVELRRQNDAYRSELELANTELRSHLKLLEADQQAGRHVQMKMMPEARYEVGEYLFSHAIIPSLYLSGDFVDYCTVGDEWVTFVLGDVSGHGASSAFVTVLLKNQLARMRSEYGRGLNKRVLSPAEFLKTVNQELLSTNTGKHVTMVVGVINTRNHHLCYSVAGHLPLPILVCGENAEYLQGKGLPVGLFDEVDYAEIDIELPEHFSLYLYSDGILELLKAESVLEKEQQLLKFCLMTGVGTTAPDVIDRFRIAKIEELPDDVALLRVVR